VISSPTILFTANTTVDITAALNVTFDQVLVSAHITN
jgi:hypothetical protein